MARKKYWIGSMGPFLYDDADPVHDPDGVVLSNQAGIVTEGSVRVLGDPEDDYDLVRKKDLATVGEHIDILTETAVVTNTITETDIFLATVKANSLVQDCLVSVELYGFYRSLENIFTLRIYFGTNLISEIESNSFAFNHDTFFHNKSFITIRTTGSSGRFIGSSVAMFQHNQYGDAMNQVAVIDMTVDQPLRCSIEWAVADADNVFALTQGIVRLSLKRSV